MNSVALKQPVSGIDPQRYNFVACVSFDDEKKKRLNGFDVLTLSNIFDFSDQYQATGVLHRAYNDGVAEFCFHSDIPDAKNIEAFVEQVCFDSLKKAKSFPSFSISVSPVS